MADTFLYVDGTLATGNNDGGGDGVLGDPTDADNWTDAYQGVAGMQSALDTAPAGAGDTLTIFVRNEFTVTVTIDGDTGEASGLGFKKIIGCIGLSGPITAMGTYVLFNASAVSGGLGGAIFNITLKNTWFENIHSQDPHGDKAIGSASLGETGFSFSSTAYAVFLKNCKATGGYRGLEALARGIYFVDCTCTGQRVNSINLNALGGYVIGGFYDGTGLSVNLNTSGATILLNVVIVGGATGAQMGGPYGGAVIGCSFYNQTTQTIDVSNGSGTVNAFNNIIHLNIPASDIAINLTSGRYFEDYNITNAINATQSGFETGGSGGHSIDGETFSNTDPFTEANADNFELNAGQTAADKCISGGLPITNWWN